MKKIFLLFLATIMLVSCGDNKDENILYVYSWADYIPQFVYEDFEDETGIKVVEDIYSSNEEMREERRKTSLIVEECDITTSGKNYKIYGTVTNNTYSTVYFVKVKVSLLDENYKVLDTETTYACGDEGIKPNESAKFDCFIEKDSNMEYYRAEIYDYD